MNPGAGVTARSMRRDFAFARCAPKAQGERLSIVSPLVRETMDDAVPAGWRFGGRVHRSCGAMTWLG
jgi:hypothetical protein